MRGPSAGEGPRGGDSVLLFAVSGHSCSEVTNVGWALSVNISIRARPMGLREFARLIGG